MAQFGRNQSNERIVRRYPYAQDFNVDTIKMYAPELIKSGTAPAAPVGQPSGVDQTIKSFNTIDEAEKANLPKGTKISVGGRMAIIE